MRAWVRALSSTLAGSACTSPRPPPLSSISPFGQRQVLTREEINSESKPVTFTNGDRAQTRFMQSLLRKQARLPPTPKSGALLLACVTGEPWGGRGEPLEEPWLHSLSC